MILRYLQIAIVSAYLVIQSSAQQSSSILSSRLPSSSDPPLDGPFPEPKEVPPPANYHIVPLPQNYEKIPYPFPGILEGFDGKRKPDPQPAGQGAFPPRDYLGYGLDLTTVTPLDIDSLTSSICPGDRVIGLDSETYTPDTVTGLNWKVPTNVDVDTDSDSIDGLVTHFTSGSDAVQKLQAQGNVKLAYEVVSGDAQVDVAIAKSFEENKQYMFMSDIRSVVKARFGSWIKHIDRDGLKVLTSRMPLVWNADDPQIVMYYRSFFSAVGTHTITEGAYGARLSLEAWASNQNIATNTSFDAFVGVYLNGLTTKGSVEAGVEKSKEYHQFLESSGKSCSSTGGDPLISGGMCQSVASENAYDDYQKWIKTTGQNPSIFSFKLTAIWNIIEFAQDPEIVKFAYPIKQAYTYLVDHPEVHKTKVRMITTSNTSRFYLRKANSFLEVSDQQAAAKAPGYTFTKTSVLFDNPDPDVSAIDAFFDFTIVSNTETIDFDLLHGPNGIQPGQGTVSLNFEVPNTGYTNNHTNPGDIYNVQSYFDIAVNPKTEDPSNAVVSPVDTGNSPGVESNGLPDVNSVNPNQNTAAPIEAFRLGVPNARRRSRFL